MNENEVIFHADRSDDESNKARQYSDAKTWIVESYSPKTTRRMIELGAPVTASLIDGHLFELDARQLIEFVAASSGLIVEFRNRRRAQLTPEQTEAKRQRMAELNARQRVAA